VSNIADFWASLWDFLDIKTSKKYVKVVDDLKKFPGTKWFLGAELNFAENLLRYRDRVNLFYAQVSDFTCVT
jgi:acetoacetyl-CoA synthetase